MCSWLILSNGLRVLPALSLTAAIAVLYQDRANRWRNGGIQTIDHLGWCEVRLSTPFGQTAPFDRPAVPAVHKQGLGASPAWGGAVTHGSGRDTPA